MDDEYWKKFEKWFGEIINRWKADGTIKRVMSGIGKDGLPDNSKPPDSDKDMFDEMNKIFEKITSKTNNQYKITLFNIYEGRTMNLFAENMNGLYFLKDCAEESPSVHEYKLFIDNILFDPKNKPEYDQTPYNKCVTKFSIIE